MGLRAAKYKGVIGLEIGEPDFNTAQSVCEFAGQAALAGRTHYTPTQGDPELIEAIRLYVRQQRQVELESAQIVITHGGQGGLVAAMRTLVDIGDQVLVPEPHFPEYVVHANYMGGEVVYIRTSFEDGFVLRPEAVEAAVTPRSKILVLNSPNNPTGAVIPGGTLDKIAQLCIKNDLLVISDEVYDRLVFDGPHESIYTRPGMSDRTVVVNSFSKGFAMTGWRIGYAYGPMWIMEELVKAASYFTVCASSVGQRAAIAALHTDPNIFKAMADEFKKRSDFVYHRLVQMPGIQVNPPGGAFYLFPRVSDLSPDGRTFALELVDKEQVVTVPGYTFGPSGEQCVRLACTVGMDKLSTAMDRIERFIHGLKR
jgi:aspartate/methionine/tyrosine aminotransferase